MNVAIDETGQNQFSAGVDDFRAHAAHSFNFRVVAHGDDFCSPDGDSLSPRLLWILGVNSAVDHDDVGRFNDEALRTRKGTGAEQRQQD